MEKKKDKKKSWVLVTVLIVALLIAAVGGGFLIGASYVTSKTMTKKSEVKEEQEEVVNGLAVSAKAMDRLVKERLERFVLAGLDYNYANGGTYRHFANGTKSLSEEVKLKMTYSITKRMGGESPVSEDVINRLEGTKPDAEEPASAMEKALFDRNYKELFNEEAPEFDAEKMMLSGCPAPMAYDKETGIMYLLNRCGGTGSDKITSTIKSFDSDEKYIYVHTESRWEDLSVSEEPPKTTKLLWTFDKELKFIRTKVEK